MKTLATLTILASSALFLGADDAVAQCRTTRGYQRFVYVQPVVTRPIVTQPVVVYGNFSHLDDLAIEMEGSARDILWEMHVNYSRNIGFNETYAEAYEMLRLASYIHDEEHHGHRSEIASAVSQLDVLFHHIEDDVNAWQPNRRHLLHGHHNSGNLFVKLERMELTLHHLMEDVGVTPGATTADPPLPNSNIAPPLPSTTLGPSLSSNFNR